MLEPVSAEAGAAGPPSAVLALLEAPRALTEYVSFVALARLLAVGREGHGRPVLVLPGLLADDRSTRPLRRLLNSAGYTASGWTEITDRHGEPASLIGWSLGGMLGYDIACRRPAAVDRLITLGSPLYSTDPRQSRGSPFYDEYATAHLPEYSRDSWRPPAVLSMPATSIFSKTDGVVRWQTCLHPPGPLRENIEVYGSHCGLGCHPAAAYAILDRLAAPTHPWPKFVPPAWLAIHFPAQPDRTQDSRASEIA